MWGVGHWPLDIIKQFVLIVMDAIGCLVEGASWNCSQTGLSRGHLKIYLSEPNLVDGIISTGPAFGQYISRR